MRPMARTWLVFCFAIGWCGQLGQAQETILGSWPFAEEEAAEQVESSTARSTTYPRTAAQPVPPNSGLQYPNMQPQMPEPELEAERPWFLRSPFAYVHWPEFHMPEIVIPKPTLPRPSLWFGKSDVEEARNTWVQESPDPERPSPLQAVTDGVRQVGASTRAAWRKTVNVFTPGQRSDASPRYAQRDSQPSFWRRMFAVEDRKAPEGPRTVTEWMEQERIKP